MRTYTRYRAKREDYIEKTVIVWYIAVMSAHEAEHIPADIPQQVRSFYQELSTNSDVPAHVREEVIERGVQRTNDQIVAWREHIPTFQPNPETSVFVLASQLESHTDPALTTECAVAMVNSAHSFLDEIKAGDNHRLAFVFLAAEREIQARRRFQHTVDIGRMFDFRTTPVSPWPYVDAQTRISQLHQFQEHLASLMYSVPPERMG